MSNHNSSVLKLEKVMTLQRGYDLPAKDRRNGIIPVISSSGISGYHDTSKCHGENVITGRYGTIGEVFYYTGDCWPLNTTLYVKDFHGNDPQYIYYLLKNVLSAYKVDGRDKSTVPGIDRNVIHQLDIHHYDDKIYQKDLCAVLNSIDELFDNNLKICLELESMAKTLYDYWFTQFDFPNAEGKPYRTSGGAMEWNEQLKREIPKGWEVKPLSYVISSINTGLNPRDNFKLGNGDIQYITVKNLTTSGTIDFSSCDTVDEDARAIIHNRSDISVGDILFASIAPLGRCYLIQDQPKNWDINESVFSIRPDYSKMTSEYLYMYFMGDSFIKGATSSSTGSIFKGIRINTLLDLVAVVPDKKVIDAFSVEIKNLLRLKEQKNVENMELAKLRDWLLPMLMNGQAVVE